MELNVDMIDQEQFLMPVGEQESNEVNEEIGSSRSAFLITTEPRQDTTQPRQDTTQQSNLITSTDSFGHVLVMDNIDFNVR